MPTFTYDQAVLLSRIKPNTSCPNELCVDYGCTDCPASNGNADCEKCQFIIPYKANYAIGANHVRSDMCAQFPPEQYPELYI